MGLNWRLGLSEWVAKKRLREEGLRMVVDLRLILQGTAWRLNMEVLGEEGLIESDDRCKETDISVWQEKPSLTDSTREKGKKRKFEIRRRLNTKTAGPCPLFP